ncbi:hypothetical protein SALBM135S_09825 [Streptomyces alboniger]
MSSPPSSPTSTSGTAATWSSATGVTAATPPRGAELYCEQVARRLSTAGVRVTYLTARPRGAARSEDTGHGRVVRGGGRYTVHLFVLLWLALNRRGVDAVIDSQNGVPFFTPLVLPRRTPVVLLVHHVHQQQFGLFLPAPLAALGRWLEASGSRLVYGKRTICTVSPSSRARIRGDLGLRGPVFLAPPGRRSGRPEPAGAPPAHRLRQPDEPPQATRPPAGGRGRTARGVPRSRTPPGR